MEHKENQMEEKIDLNDPKYYNNRELSWLAFNERVLEEALDSRNPLLERLKFLSIFSSNLDEFFMVRVAGLKDQVKAGYKKPDNKSGMTPTEQLNSIYMRCHQMVQKQDQIFTQYFLPQLEEEKIQFLTIQELHADQLQFLKERFEDHILPVLTPLAIDAYHPFPKLLSRSLNLAICLKRPDQTESNKLAIVQVPIIFERVIELPSMNENKTFILLEDVISHFMQALFIGYEVCSISPFRITRNADMTLHEEGARDLLREIEKELKKRKWGAAVRLEIRKGHMDEKVLRLLIQVLELEEEDIYSLTGPLDLTFLFKFYSQVSDEYKHLTYEPYVPQPPLDLDNCINDDLFQCALEKDLFFHHPFESFQTIVDFISSAADDPNVLAIKQTLYRVSGESPIIEALARAADKGKQVMVLVELKARFDEEKNIQWAKKLEQAGVHVIYGMTDLKTHSKITLIVRQNEGKVQRFVHLSTGNYNEKTASLYTDMGLLTSNESFGEDATDFFNYLSGYRLKPEWNYFSTSPYQIRDTFLELIDQEIAFHEKTGEGRIIAKMNSVTDKPIIMKLYEASQAGVKIDLIVRGICCLKPQVKGVSENITVRSIVGRFLEHTRIFYFHHYGEHKLYLSSADWMTRNMERRVEILFPILDHRIKERLIQILNLYLKDNTKARMQDHEGKYHYILPENGVEIDAQQILLDLSYEAVEHE